MPITSAMYLNADKTMISVVVDGETKFVPNDLSADNHISRQLWRWVNVDGNKIEDYVEPTLTPEESRKKAIADDDDRKDLLTKLQSSTPAQIRAYVASNTSDTASMRSLLTKVLLLLAAPSKDAP